MHVIMQMHKYSNIIVERADFSFTDTEIFKYGNNVIFYFILLLLLFIHLFFRIFILFNSAFIATLYYLGFILTYATCAYIYFIF